jgi:hypothetical protein
MGLLVIVTVLRLGTVPRLAFGQFLDAVEVLGPELAEALDPGGGVPKRLRDEAQTVFAALLAAPQQAGLLEDADVFRDGRQRHGERGGDRRDRHFSTRDSGEDGPPRGVGQGEENSAQRLG